MQFHAFGDRKNNSILALHGMLYFHTDEYLNALRAVLEGQA